MYRIIEHTPERLALVQGRVSTVVAWSSLLAGLAGLIAVVAFSWRTEFSLPQWGFFLTFILLALGFGSLMLLTIRHRLPGLTFDHARRLLRIIPQHGSACELPYQRLGGLEVDEIPTGNGICTFWLRLETTDHLSLSFLQGGRDALVTLAAELNDILSRGGSETLFNLSEPTTVRLERDNGGLRVRWRGRSDWPLALTAAGFCLALGLSLGTASGQFGGVVALIGQILAGLLLLLAVSLPLLTWHAQRRAHELVWDREGLLGPEKRLPGQLSLYWIWGENHLIALSEAGESAWLALRSKNPSHPFEPLLQRVDAAHWLRIDLPDLDTFEILSVREHLLAWHGDDQALSSEAKETSADQKTVL